MDALSTTAIIGYIIGGFIGSVICVACDRAWRVYENKVRLDVTISSYSDYERDDLNIAIINKGFNALPPSHLVIWVELEKDQSWSERVFDLHPNTKGDGTWWPYQQKAFVKNIKRKGRLNPELKAFFEEYRSPIKVELVLAMESGSGKPVWKSQEMGESVLAYLRAAYEQGKFPEGVTTTRHLKYETWGDWWRRIRGKRGD